MSTSPPESALSKESRVRDFRLVKEPKACKNRRLSKIQSAYSRPSYTLVPVYLAREAMDLSTITLPLVENKCN